MGLTKRISRFFSASENADSKHNDPALYNGPYLRRPESSQRTEHLSRPQTSTSSYDKKTEWRQLASYTQSRVLPLCCESVDFCKAITISGLSHLLIWYLYHDLVPVTQSSRHRYLELPRDQMIGFVRLSHEMEQYAQQTERDFELPRRLQAIINNLNLDCEGVLRRLKRLADRALMSQKEIQAMPQTAHAWMVVGDKLMDDRNLVTALRPIDGTVWFDWQQDILKWIDRYIKALVVPAVDHTKSIVDMEETRERDRITNFFQQACEPHADPPMESIHEAAFASILRSTQDSQNSLSSVALPRKRSGLAIHPFGQSSLNGLQRRRRSAPIMLDNDRTSIPEEASLEIVHNVSAPSPSTGYREELQLRDPATGVTASERANHRLGKAQEEIERNVVSPFDEPRRPKSRNNDSRPGSRASIVSKMSNILSGFKPSRSTPDLRGVYQQNQDLEEANKYTLDVPCGSNSPIDLGFDNVETEMAKHEHNRTLPPRTRSSAGQESMQLSDLDDDLHRGRLTKEVVEARMRSGRRNLISSSPHLPLRSTARPLSGNRRTMFETSPGQWEEHRSRPRGHHRAQSVTEEAGKTVRFDSPPPASQPVFGGDDLPTPPPRPFSAASNRSNRQTFPQLQDFAESRNVASSADNQSTHPAHRPSTPGSNPALRRVTDSHGDLRSSATSLRLSGQVSARFARGEHRPVQERGRPLTRGIGAGLGLGGNVEGERLQMERQRERRNQEVIEEVHGEGE